MDWKKCILCQQYTTENLQRPYEIKDKSNVGAGYISLIDTLLKFKEIGHDIPDISTWKTNSELCVKDILIQQEAKWHKSCRNKFNSLKLERAAKRHIKGDHVADTTTPSKATRYNTLAAASCIREVCLFCNETGSDKLHKVSTFNVDSKIKKYAIELEDTILLAKLSAGDLISQEAVYHVKCYTELTNRAKSINNTDDKRSVINGIALAELISSIEDEYQSNQNCILVLADLSKLYDVRVKHLSDGEKETKVNSTWLKNKILSHMPMLHAYSKGKNVLLAYRDSIGEVLEKVNEYNHEDEGRILLRAAKIIRRDMLKMKTNFSGTFDRNCQQTSVPLTLKTFVDMTLNEPNIKNQKDDRIVDSQTTLSVAQLLYFNSIIERRNFGNSNSYHSVSREPPLPLYIGLMIHAETRKKGLIDKLNHLGLSVSYNRVLEISTQLGNSASERFKDENIVCPPKLRHNLFTTGAVDNIDHNPSSSTASGSLHGTAISIFQHPTQSNKGQERDVNLIDKNNKTKTISPLPDYYSNVEPVLNYDEHPSIPELHDEYSTNGNLMKEALSHEKGWLNKVLVADESDLSNLSWPAYHADRTKLNDNTLSPLDLTTLLPLFEEPSKSVAMIRHSINLTKKCTDFLNPGQNPVLACDQPLYAIAKIIQWNWPDLYGENKLVVMLGGLHIEIAALKCLGDMLDESGWTNMITQAGIASSGKANALLHASHVSKTRHAHQVTAASLHTLMHRGYEQYMCDIDNDVDILTFDQWVIRQKENCAQFKFWALELQLELIVLIFIRSLRQGNFQLYKESLTALVPWFFALDHHNYACWTSVHIRDMANLDTAHPEIFEEFCRGHFVVKKSHRTFSSIALDHSHEQNNKLVKGDGGAVGLTENSSQLLRWMVAGPEIARVVQEFETSYDHLLEINDIDLCDTRHHEQTDAHQKSFRSQVNGLCAVIEECGNPFMEQTNDLLVLDSRDIMEHDVIETVRNIEDIGNRQYTTFSEERLKTQTVPIFDVVKQNKLPLFKCRPTKEKSAANKQMATLKQNCSLFSSLYISCQVRNSDLTEFFKHENLAYPPSIAQFGKIRSCVKSDLLKVFEKEVPSSYLKPNIDVLLMDGAAVVNMLRPGATRTFKEYADAVYKPYILRCLHDVERLDIIWDIYLEDSLKATERNKRGKGVRRRVQPDTRLPGNWESFLRLAKNKEELFEYLAIETTKLESDKQIITTFSKGVLTLQPLLDTEAESINPCDHEEADTRLLLHTKDAVTKGYNKIGIRTVDTDVVVLSIFACPNLFDLGLVELWILFGNGKHFRYIPAHEIYQNLGPRKSIAMTAFHAFTGCDQTSSFLSKGKKSAWETWKSYNAVTDAFLTLSKPSTEADLGAINSTLQKFVVLLYDKTSNCKNVDEARHDLFTRKGRSMENIPPTSAALKQHIKRVAYQSGYVWGKSEVPIQELPSPMNWGWKMDGQTPSAWEPYWTDLSTASASCQELIKCGCKTDKGCRNRCSCVKADMLCTALCNCGGNCDRGNA